MEGPAVECRQLQMKKQFIRLTTGWIPVSVLLLFTIALIAGQARANLPSEIKAAPVLPVLTTSVSVVRGADMSEKLEALPHLLDTVLALPSDSDVSINADTLTLDSSGDGSSPSRPKAPCRSSEQ